MLSELLYNQKSLHWQNQLIENIFYLCMNIKFPDILLFLCFTFSLTSSEDLCIGDSSNEIVLSMIDYKKFLPLPADYSTFEKFLPIFNPVFQLRDIPTNGIANRILLGGFIQKDLNQIMEDPFYSQRTYFELNTKKRKYFLNLLHRLNKHLANFPKDLSAFMWVSNLQLKLGNISGAVHNLKSAASIIDIVIEETCQEYMLFGTVKVRNDRCERVMATRTQIANRAAMVMLMRARSGRSLGEMTSLSLEAMEIWQENYRTLSRFDGLTLLSPPSTNPGMAYLPATTRSSLLHAQNQLEHICNVLTDSAPAHARLGSPVGWVDGSCTGTDGRNLSAIMDAFRFSVSEADRVNAAISTDAARRHLSRGRPSRYLLEATEYVVLPDEAISAVGPYLHRNLHSSPSSSTIPTAVINLTTVSNLDKSQLHLGANVLVIDNLFTTDALQAYRSFCLESTMWHAPRSGGYMCAFMDMGFASPLVAQTVAELQHALPEVFCDFALTNAWGYKYADSDEAVGTNIHADFAAVNVNCWIVPEDELVDSGSGGMVVWPTRPPEEWSSLQYNEIEGVSRYQGRDGRYHVDLEYQELDSRRKVEQWAKASESSAPIVKIPYRSNRCVIFDSSLLHATSHVRFGKGYQRRRVNLTYLFGSFRQTCANAKDRRLELEDAAAYSRAGM